MLLNETSLREVIKRVGISSMLKHMIEAIPEPSESYTKNLREDLVTALANYEDRYSEKYDDFGSPIDKD